jgi:hypothetical protein
MDVVKPQHVVPVLDTTMHRLRNYMLFVIRIMCDIAACLTVIGETMTTAIYHLTAIGPKRCYAQPGNCPITRNTDDSHYQTLQAAQVAFEKRMKSQCGGTSCKTMSRQKNNDWIEPVIITPASDKLEYLNDIKSTLESLGESLDVESEEYCVKIINGEIPNELPKQMQENYAVSTMAHSLLCETGYYAKVTRKFAKSLARVVGNGTLLDPMAGKGYLVKALRDEGVKTIGTDDNSWQLSQGLEQMDAQDALRKYGDSITHLAIVWAPYDNTIDAKLVQMVKDDYPHVTIVNVGEPYGGCTGSDRFWDEVIISSNQPLSYETSIHLSDEALIVKPR